MFIKLRMLVLVLRNGEMGELFEGLQRRIWSTEVSFRLSRDVTVPFSAPRSRIPFAIRELQTADHPAVLRERPRRLAMLRKNVPTCYVAESENGEICYMQWLIGPTSNDAVRQVFGSRCPPLQRDEALLEFAYTFVAARGKNVMPRAMGLISNKAADLGCRQVITFVREENVPALKGCRRAGFRPDRRQSVRWRLFFPVRVETVELAEDTPFPYEQDAIVA